MITTYTILVCDAPGCEAKLTVGSLLSCNLWETALASNWFIADNSITSIVACPNHSSEAKEVQLAIHQWELDRVVASSEWAEQHSFPIVPEWLEWLERLS
jgi:hypothetical protein